MDPGQLEIIPLGVWDVVGSVWLFVGVPLLVIVGLGVSLALRWRRTNPALAEVEQERLVYAELGHQLEHLVTTLEELVAITSTAVSDDAKHRLRAALNKLREDAA